MPESVEIPAPVSATMRCAASTQDRTCAVFSLAMINSNIRRIIEIATPLWAGEAEVVRTYWTSPKRNLQTDLLWLSRQCFKEFWGSGVTKFDQGGIVPQSLRRLSEQTPNIDREMQRHEFLEALEGVVAEFSHYCAFADLYDAMRPQGTPQHTPTTPQEWPEEKALTALRYRHREAHSAIGMRACKTSEGGYCTLFSEGMKLRGKPGFDGMIAEACAKVYDDEFGHMLSGIAGIAEEGFSEADWKLLGTLLAEQLKQRIRMRNEQFSFPLSEERVHEIFRGDIQPLQFDYERAKLAA